MIEQCNEPLVCVQNLGMSYQLEHGAVHALKQINLTIYPGEFVAIMGPSGSGKSTLLHLLGCLDSPTTGHYYLNGQDISALKDQQLAHIRSSQIGFVFQSFNLIPQLNVFENIEVPFLYQPQVLQENEIRERILTAIERVKLKNRLYHTPLQLSGGEMQRVAIARALAIHPLLILADEPTGNLDTETGEAILQLFKNLHGQGVTIILITHDEEVGAHCQRMIRMRDGQIILDQHKE
jgi:putative ABC transport system ATP-binding protein